MRGVYREGKHLNTWSFDSEQIKNIQFLKCLNPLAGLQFAPAAGSLFKMPKTPILQHRCSLRSTWMWHKFVLGFPAQQRLFYGEVKASEITLADLLWLLLENTTWNGNTRRRDNHQFMNFGFALNAWMCVFICERQWKRELSNAGYYESMKRESYCLIWGHPQWIDSYIFITGKHSLVIACREEKNAH